MLEICEVAGAMTASQLGRAGHLDNVEKVELEGAQEGSRGDRLGDVGDDLQPDGHS